MNDSDPDEAIHISSNDARGASSTDADNGDSLLPMLGIGLFLIIVGVIVVLFVMR